MGGERKEGKLNFEEKKLEIDRHNRPKQKSELKTKKHDDRSIKESEQQAVTIA